MWSPSSWISSRLFSTSHSETRSLHATITAASTRPCSATRMWDLSDGLLFCFYLPVWSEGQTSLTWRRSGPLAPGSTPSRPRPRPPPWPPPEPWSPAWTASLPATPQGWSIYIHTITTPSHSIKQEKTYTKKKTSRFLVLPILKSWKMSIANSITVNSLLTKKISLWKTIHVQMFSNRLINSVNTYLKTFDFPDCFSFLFPAKEKSKKNVS